MFLSFISFGKSNQSRQNQEVVPDKDLTGYEEGEQVQMLLERKEENVMELFDSSAGSSENDIETTFF